MSLLIAVYVNEGIVLASDRRTTYSNTQILDGKAIKYFGIHTTNTTDKTFLCPNNAGISTCGDASLLGKPITGFIQEMIRTRISASCRVMDMPQIVIDYFNNQSQIPDTNFLIAGYDTVDSKNVQQLYRVNVKNKSITKIDTSFQGAFWDGEILTLSRLLQNVALKTQEGQYTDLPFEDILWGYFTLQDAIDFARYAVETTIQTMRFKNVVETVGGAVDILLITPDGTQWLQKENLK